MYLVKDRFLGREIYVFTHVDPRKDGYGDGPVSEADVPDYDLTEIHRWPDGTRPPEPQLGRNRKNPKQFKVFRSRAELDASGFEFESEGAPVVVYSWSDYHRLLHPDAENLEKRVRAMSQDEWFEHLEETDEQRRVGWRRNGISAPASNSSNDQIAQWVAGSHMGADGAIDQVWYLPVGAPEGEIRLLEVNSRYADEREKIRPLDFGLDVEGREFKLLVADVSAEHLDRIKAEPMRLLPPGWKLENALTWDRKGSLV